MTKTLNQLGEATDLGTPDLLLARDTSTGDDKRITLNNSRFSRHGLTESVTLSTGTLTIPVGMSTIKLPASVWDGSSNITISAIAFENGVQPAVGYEFSVVIPKTTTAGSLVAGALGNEVLIQDGASIAVEANNNKDFPCYPNAADNPGTDPVQFAAPYYRLDFRVDSYDGSGNPVVSLVRLPDAVSGSNDIGKFWRSPTAQQSISMSVIFDNTDTDTQIYPCPVDFISDFADSSISCGEFGAEAFQAVGAAGHRLTGGSNSQAGVRDTSAISNTSGLEIKFSGSGEWY